MKTFVSIFAAAVIGGLGSYLLFEYYKAIALDGTNVVVNISAFVILLTTVALAAAALSALFNLAISNADRKMVGRLEGRIRALEQVPPAGAVPHAAPPAGEAS